MLCRLLRGDKVQVGDNKHRTLCCHGKCPSAADPVAGSGHKSDAVLQKPG